MSQNKILVTVGAGFVVSHSCESSRKDTNNKVYSLDNYFTGSEANHVPNVTYIKGDTSDIASLVNVLLDMVYHLGEDSTRTTSAQSPSANRERFDVVLPLSCTTNEYSGQKVNDCYDQNAFLLGSYIARVFNRCARFMIGRNIL
jgi:hypothetical protein